MLHAFRPKKQNMKQKQSWNRFNKDFKNGPRWKPFKNKQTKETKFSVQCLAQEVKSESESHSVGSDSLRPHGPYSPWNFPGQNTGVGSLSLLQEIFPIQGSNPGFLYSWWILCQLSHKGRPRILVCVAYPFSSGSFRPRNRTGSPTLQVNSLPTEHRKKESEVAQSCTTLFDPMDCSLSGSSIHGIFQARILGVGCHFLLQGIFLT